MAICTTKVSLSTFNAAITNSLGSTSWTRSVVGRALLVVYDFYVSVPSPNDTSVLLSFKKGISRITSNLMSATKNVSLKESRPAAFILYLKISNHHPKGL